MVDLLKKVKNNEEIPDSMKNLQACTQCLLLLSGSQWNKTDSCPNCRMSPVDPTPEFKGMISSIFPRDSWVSKWNGLTNKIPGIYAISIEGDLNGYEQGANMQGEDENPEDIAFVVGDDEVE